MIGSFRSIQSHVLTSLVAVCFPMFEAHAQSGETSTNGIQIIRPEHPVWLLEQPYANNPMLTARTNGSSTYGNYQVNASLQITCHPQSRTAGLTLQIAPSALGFDSDPFEGPDATAKGPLRIRMGTGPAVDHRVSGSWTDGGAFQVGVVFAFGTSISRAQLLSWVNDAAGGLPLKLSVAPAGSAGMPLTATFSLPKNNVGLKKAMQPCLGISKQTS